MFRKYSFLKKLNYHKRIYLYDIFAKWYYGIKEECILEHTYQKAQNGIEINYFAFYLFAFKLP